MKKDALILCAAAATLLPAPFTGCGAQACVLVLEAEHPAAIRRQVSLCEAVYEGETAVEGLRAVRIETLAQAEEIWKQNAVPVLVDPQGKSIAPAKPDVLVDAILAKRILAQRGIWHPDHCTRPRFHGRAGCGCGGGNQTRPPAGTHHWKAVPSLIPAFPESLAATEKSA